MLPVGRRHAEAATAYFAHEHIDGLLLVKRRSAAQHHVERHAHRPQVDALIVAWRWRPSRVSKEPWRHLGRGIQRRAAEVAEPRLGQEAGRAHVDDLETIARFVCEANILGLQIAVDDARLVQLRDRVGHLRKEAHRLLLGICAALLDGREQVAARH